MTEDIYNLKYIDENNNEYIVSATTEYDNKKYALMINLNNNRDYFFAEINNDKDISLEIVDNESLLKKLIDSFK